MSAGIPILTNDIGIEGIPAKDGETYFHCTTPEEYIEKINILLKDDKCSYSMSKKQKELSKGLYDVNKSLKIFTDHILNLSK